MANEEHLNVLSQGVETWNKWRAENPRMKFDLRKIVLRGQDIDGINFRRVDLREADLGQTSLCGADFSMANLHHTCLEGARLHGTNFRGANLREAALEDAKLCEAIHYSGVYLKGADLREANLREAQLGGADLQGVDFRRADLSGAFLYMANLIEARLDGATLTNAWLWETLRAGWSIKGLICEAVYWDEHGKERSVYDYGEFERLHADQIKIVLYYDGGISPIEFVTLPSLIKHVECIHPGCILRFHSIEDAAGAAAVKLTIEEGSNQDPVKFEVLKTDLELTAQRLISLERKALKEELMRQQAEHTLKFLNDSFFPTLLASVIKQSKGISISIPRGELTMGDKYIGGQVGAQGRGAHAHDMTFVQLWSQSGESIDLSMLAAELATLRQHLRQEAVEPEHDVSIGAIANAEMAAKEGNGPKSLEWLSRASTWTLDNASKIGVGVATAALKTALGL